MPTSTSHDRYRVANAIAINWDLSPSSATKITPKLTASAAPNPCICTLPVCEPGLGADDLDPASQPESKVSPTPPPAGPRGRAPGRQHVDHDVGSYSPSLAIILPDLVRTAAA